MAEQQNKIITQISLPDGKVYDIYDSKAYHTVEDLHLAQALTFKDVLDPEEIKDIKKARVGDVYLISDTGEEYICIQDFTTEITNWDTNWEQYWEKLGNIHDAAPSNHQHYVTVTGDTISYKISGTADINGTLALQKTENLVASVHTQTVYMTANTTKVIPENAEFSVTIPTVVATAAKLTATAVAYDPIVNKTTDTVLSGIISERRTFISGIETETTEAVTSISYTTDTMVTDVTYSVQTMRAPEVTMVTYLVAPVSDTYTFWEEGDPLTAASITSYATVSVPVVTGNTAITATKITVNTPVTASKISVAETSISTMSGTVDDLGCLILSYTTNTFNAVADITDVTASLISGTDVTATATEFTGNITATYISYANQPIQTFTSVTHSLINNVTAVTREVFVAGTDYVHMVHGMSVSTNQGVTGITWTTETAISSLSVETATAITTITGETLTALKSVSVNAPSIIVTLTTTTDSAGIDYVQSISTSTKTFDVKTSYTALEVPTLTAQVGGQYATLMNVVWDEHGNATATTVTEVVVGASFTTAATQVPVVGSVSVWTPTTAAILTTLPTIQTTTN